jgi:hypothetical protein
MLAVLPRQHVIGSRCFPGNSLLNISMKARIRVKSCKVAQGIVAGEFKNWQPECLKAGDELVLGQSVARAEFEVGKEHGIDLVFLGQPSGVFDTPVRRHLPGAGGLVEIGVGCPIPRP